VGGGIPARLSRAEGRRFGLVVGTAFLLLGALFLWRGRPAPARLLGAVGGALLLLGLLLPTLLLPVQRVWMSMALAISKVTTPLLLGVMYFGVITPIGVARRFLGRDPMKARRLDRSFWVNRNSDARQHRDMERQF
jgi:saxitoxin biosynthesis operon SxtJ-like protein